MRKSQIASKPAFEPKSPVGLWKGKSLMETLLVKGKHFDRNGERWGLPQLLELEGLFQFKDIKDRLPIPERQVRYLFDRASFVDVFFLFKVSDNYSRLLMDLNAFCLQYNARFISPQGEAGIEDGDLDE